MYHNYVPSRKRQWRKDPVDLFEIVLCYRLRETLNKSPRPLS